MKICTLKSYYIFYLISEFLCSVVKCISADVTAVLQFPKENECCNECRCVGKCFCCWHI